MQELYICVCVCVCVYNKTQQNIFEKYIMEAPLKIPSDNNSCGHQPFPFHYNIHTKKKPLRIAGRSAQR